MYSKIALQNKSSFVGFVGEHLGMVGFRSHHRLWIGTMYNFPSTSQMCATLCWCFKLNPNKTHWGLWLYNKMWESSRFWILFQDTLHAFYNCDDLLSFLNHPFNMLCLSSSKPCQISSGSLLSASNLGNTNTVACKEKNLLQRVNQPLLTSACDTIKLHTSVYKKKQRAETFPSQHALCSAMEFTVCHSFEIFFFCQKIYKSSITFISVMVQTVVL